MNNCKKMDKKCEYADRLGMCENITATCSRSRTMRLIDAEALYKRIPACVCVPCTFSKEIEKDCRDCVVQRVINIVDNFPTIDAVEVVRGKWKIDEYGIYHCPICHAINNTVYKSFCPNCGMRSDGEDRDDETN